MRKKKNISASSDLSFYRFTQILERIEKVLVKYAKSYTRKFKNPRAIIVAAVTDTERLILVFCTKAFPFIFSHSYFISEDENRSYHRIFYSKVYIYLKIGTNEMNSQHNCRSVHFKRNFKMKFTELERYCSK